ncbi:MAG: PIG-L family deacetylase [Tunicatimonas sp.]
MNPIRILYISAHPDDGEVYGGGTAALWSQAGHAVKMISLTDGRAGHHQLSGTELVDRRSRESVVAAQRLGVAYEILDNPDGQLEPTLYNRNRLIGKIREWQADVVVTHRPNDYHPDHRYTSQLVQDAAYLVMVPNLVPEVLPLRKNPVFLYFADRFRKPTPFSPDVAVAIDDVYHQKLVAMHAHTSQFYEWLPWIEDKLEEVPEADGARLEWLKQRWPFGVDARTREALNKWYGSEKAQTMQHAEAFELCEYGHQPSEDEIRQLFPMLY